MIRGTTDLGESQKKELEKHRFSKEINLEIRELTKNQQLVLIFLP